MQLFIPYFLKVNIFLAILFSAYWLLARNNKNFQWNRFYLLSTLLLSFVIPVISLPAETSLLAENYKIESFDAVFQYSAAQQNTSISNMTGASINFQNIFVIIYLTISIYLLSTFILELFYLVKKINSSIQIKKGSYTLVIDENIKSPFSFFHYVFVDRASEINKLIIEHEKVHIRNFHTIDLIITQAVSAFLWINPFAYLLKKELIAQHEYLADEGVLKKGNNKKEYLQQIYIQAQNGFNYRLTSKFNNSLTHKRLKMMKKINYNKEKVFTHILLVAITLFITGFYACSNTDSTLIDKTDLSVKQTEPVLTNQENRISVNIPKGLPIRKENIKGTTGFGYKMHPILKEKKMHTGIDFEADRGSPVYATADGIIKSTEYKGGYGNCIIIEHANDYSTLYAHLKNFNTAKGNEVHAGDIIGYVGATGMTTKSQLHYEIRIKNKFMNPENFLK